MTSARHPWIPACAGMTGNEQKSYTDSTFATCRNVHPSTRSGRTEFEFRDLPGKNQNENHPHRSNPRLGTSQPTSTHALFGSGKKKGTT